jgi:hypothetical protein
VPFPARVEDAVDPVEVVLEILAEADFSWCFEELPVGPVLECANSSMTAGSSRVLPENGAPCVSNHAAARDLIRRREPPVRVVVVTRPTTELRNYRRAFDRHSNYGTPWARCVPLVS